jgi:transposase
VADERAHRLDLQEKTLGAAERDELSRQAWRDEVATWDPSEVVVFDETGAHVAMTPAYARAPRNARAYDRVPFNSGTNITTLAVLTTAGLEAAMTVEGAADTATVEAFVEACVVPRLRPGQKVVLDNVRTHKSAGLRQLIAAAGCELHFLPPYSPDLSPIEEAFAQVKTVLRRAKARTTEAVQQAIGPALNAVTPQDARHYFAHCGYGVATLPCKTL